MALLRWTSRHEEIARNTAENPAALVGIDGAKGRIEAGRDADLVLVERLDKPETLHKEQLVTKSRESAVLYDGTQMTHRIKETLVRGTTVFKDGTITVSHGFGQLIIPKS